MNNSKKTLLIGVGIILGLLINWVVSLIFHGLGYYFKFINFKPPFPIPWIFLAPLGLIGSFFFVRKKYPYISYGLLLSGIAILLVWLILLPFSEL